MKVREVEVSESSRGTRVSAVVVWETQGRAAEPIEFLYREIGAQDVVTAGDAVAAAVLLPAMACGEDVSIDAPVSPRLVVGASEIAKKWSTWRRRWRSSRIEAPPGNRSQLRPTESAACFSGGVDSFYTALRARSEPITMLLTLRGGFSPQRLLGRVDLDAEMADLAQAAAILSMRHVVVESNVIQFGRPYVAVQHHGATLAAMALGLGASIRRFYIPSSWSHERKRPWGSHPDLDALWSTEALEVVHDGAEFERHEKIHSIAACSLVLERLRVCNERWPGVTNCGRCDKCLSTALALLIAGRLDSSRSFGSMTTTDVRRTVISGSAVEDFEMLRAELDDPELKRAITWALRRAALRRYARPLSRILRRAGLRRKPL